MNVGMASLHNHVNCERRKSLTKSEFLASWPIVLWIATMMATSVVCALPELISPGDPDIVLVWNVSYITKSPLGKPQQVIVINGELPGPTIVAKTNDVVEIQ